MEVCFSVLEGISQFFSKDLKSDDDLVLIFSDVTRHLVTCFEKARSLVTTEVLKLSAELIFDTASGTANDTLRTINDLVIFLAQNLQMLTNESKDCLRTYVQRDDRDW